MRDVALASICVLALFACGRTGVARRDGSVAQDVSASAVPDSGDGASDPAPSAAEVGPPDLSPPGCPPLANRGLLNLGYIKQALFAADGRSLLVRIGVADSDAKDDARVIQLPSGDSRVLASGVRNVEWLGPAGVLATTNDAIVAIAPDGGAAHASSGMTCSHVATPDGLRVYVTSGCDRGVGALDVLDVVTGAVTRIAASILTSGLAVSPDSRWAAYVSSDAATGTSVIHVVDAAGSVTTVPGSASAFRPVFVSGQTLLFLSQASAGPTIWRYDLAQQKTQLLIDDDPGIAGYEIAPDGSALLAARFGNVSTRSSGELYLVPIGGGSPVRLATDLLDYRMFSMMMRVFAFAPVSNRVLYLADTASDAGRGTGTSSVATDGSQSRSLSANATAPVMSSHADRIALIAVDRALGRSTIDVVSAGGARQFTVAVEGDVSFAGFVPRDRGLLFVRTSADAAGNSSSELRHLSFSSGNVTQLGFWRTSKLTLSNYPVGISTHEYPVDPHGCYTVVDSDYSQTAATLVAVPD